MPASDLHDHMFVVEHADGHRSTATGPAPNAWRLAASHGGAPVALRRMTVAEADAYVETGDLPAVGVDADGILWDAHEVSPSPPKRYRGDDRDMGMTIFASPQHRADAIAWLCDLGYRYFTDYVDAQGFGLSWARRCGPSIRPEARDRLPSVQRARRDQRARGAFQASLYRNPSYDLIHDPR